MDDSAEYADRKASCFVVPRDEIAANDYDLSFNKYRQVEYVAEEFPPTREILSDIKADLADLAQSLKELEAMA